MKQNKFFFTIPISLIVYFVVAVVPMHTSLNEIIPFSSFRLFSLTPETVESYSIRITSLPGFKLEKPTLYYDSPMPNKRWKMEGIFNKFGKQYDTNKEDHEPGEFYKATIAALPPGTEFELIKRTYTPVEYYQSKTCDIQVIETFVVKP